MALKSMSSLLARALAWKGLRGPKPLNGKRQRRRQDWASRADTPWEALEVHWYGGQCNQLWGCSHTALWYTPGLPPVALRFGLVCDPEGKRRLEAFFCPDLQATPAQILAWVIRRWAVEVTCEDARAHLGVETPRPWSDKAIARTTPVRLALCSRVTVLALPLSQHGHIPVPVTAWYHKDAPPFTDGLAVVRRHLWRAQYWLNSTAAAEFVQCPRQAFDLLRTGLP